MAPPPVAVQGEGDATRPQSVAFDSATVGLAAVAILVAITGIWFHKRRGQQCKFECITVGRHTTDRGQMPEAWNLAFMPDTIKAY